MGEEEGRHPPIGRANRTASASERPTSSRRSRLQEGTEEEGREDTILARINASCARMEATIREDLLEGGTTVKEEDLQRPVRSSTMKKHLTNGARGYERRQRSVPRKITDDGSQQLHSRLSTSLPSILKNPGQGQMPLKPALKKQPPAHNCRLCGKLGAKDDRGARGPLIAPCLCRGRRRYVHERCIHQWAAATRATACDRCNFEFHGLRVNIPACDWKRPPLGQTCCTLLVKYGVILAFLACLAASSFLIHRLVVDRAEVGDTDRISISNFMIVALCLLSFIIILFLPIYLMLDARLDRFWRDFNRIILVEGLSEEQVDAASCGKWATCIATVNFVNELSSDDDPAGR